MSKFDEKLEKYQGAMDKLGIERDDALLKACTKACGPSIYNKDAECVSTGDVAEVDRVKNNFMIKKLGLSESDDLDAGIAYVIEKMGKSNRTKYRAIVNLLLVRKYGKEDLFK